MTHEEIQNDDGTFTVRVTPPAVFKLPPQEVRLTQDQFIRYQQWRDGPVLIQHALYDLSDSDREKLMTGVSDEWWDKLADSEDE